MPIPEKRCPSLFHSGDPMQVSSWNAHWPFPSREKICAIYNAGRENFGKTRTMETEIDV